MDHRVRTVIALMEEHLRQDWPASRWAQFVNISPSRLHQLFKDETGVPPARYLRLLRMGRAKKLLETSYLSVKEVMARVGLADESHFVRDFKRSYGCTPARYRERFHRPPDPRPVPAATPLSPLLLRRPSHPRHLAQDEFPLLRAKKKRELLTLIRQRHLAFAALTARITCNLARTLSKQRSISYRPRRSTVPRQPPPSQRRSGKSANKL
ncbi:MAG TPA: AraC family transcriptional regulator [Pyrinomonadaceae bacterium]|nr:AraC family transcriptional regulator [Pyrinomonadaceae bacterium]